MVVWGSFCHTCGRYIRGIHAARPGLPWRKLLPYCGRCKHYALHGIHLAALAIVLALCAAALYLLLKWRGLV